MKKFIILCIGILLSISASAEMAQIARNFNNGSGSVDEFINYIGNPKNEREVYDWAKANPADATAIYILGRCYEKGIMKEINHSKAAEKYMQATQKGNMAAKYALAWLYIDGNGVKKDVDKGVALIKELAAANYPPGYIGIGYLYEFGTGVEQSYTKAFAYYEKAMKTGFSTGYANLGALYAEGKGVDFDKARAEQLYKIAAEKGNAHAYGNLGYIYKNKYYDDHKSNEAYIQKAIEYFTKGAEMDNTRCINALGDIAITNEDYKEAIKWYEKSLAKGDATAKILIGNMYLQGLGYDQDSEKGFKLLKEGTASRTWYWPCFRMAECYMGKYGCKKNMVEALKWALKTLDYADDYCSSAESETLLGKIYLYGGDGVGDYYKAMKHLKTAAYEGWEEACQILDSLGERYDQEEPTVSISATH